MIVRTHANLSQPHANKHMNFMRARMFLVDDVSAGVCVCMYVSASVYMYHAYFNACICICVCLYTCVCMHVLLHISRH